MFLDIYPVLVYIAEVKKYLCNWPCADVTGLFLLLVSFLKKKFAFPNISYGEASLKQIHRFSFYLVLEAEVRKVSVLSSRLSAKKC